MMLSHGVQSRGVRRRWGSQEAVKALERRLKTPDMSYIHAASSGFTQNLLYTGQPLTQSSLLVSASMLLPHEKPDSLPLGLAKPLHKCLLGKFRVLMRQLSEPQLTGPSVSLDNWISSKL